MPTSTVYDNTVDLMVTKGFTKDPMVIAHVPYDIAERFTKNAEAEGYQVLRKISGFTEK